MVYRPPKHKLAGGGGFGSSRPGANRPSSDPLSGATNPVDDLAAGLPDDDRNLVAVDESYSGGDFEDRLWLLWRRQGKNLTRLVAAIAMAILLWEGWNLYQAHVISSLQAENQTAADKGAEGLLAFADAHPNAVLGKLAVLEAADAYYKGGKFKEASAAYEKAISIWGIDEKGQRARIGWALSLLQGGDAQSAQEHLIALAQDSSVLENFRAEAAFYTAVSFAQAGDKDNATKWIDEVKQYKNDTLWNRQAAALAEMIPILSDMKLMPGAAATTSPKATPIESSLGPIPAMTTKPVSATPAASTAAVKPPAATAAPAASTGEPQFQPLNLPKISN